MTTRLITSLTGMLCLVFAMGCKKDGQDRPAPTPIISGTPPASDSITGFSPYIEGIGYPIVINGTFLNNNFEAYAVTINGVVAESLDVTNSQLTVLVPVGASTGKVVVTVDGKTLVAPNDIIIKKATLTTIAGTGISGQIDGAGDLAAFSGNWGVVSDRSGNLYVADSYNSAIRKITPGGFVSTVAGSRNAQDTTNGPVSVAKFIMPTGIAIDKIGNMYISDEASSSIRKIDTSGIVSTVAGSMGLGWADGAGTIARFNEPLGLAADANNNIYVADGGNNRIRKISPQGIVSTFAGGGLAGSTDGQGYYASFGQPSMIVLDPAGNLYVTDANSNKIRKITATGYVSTFAGSGLAGDTDGQGTSATFNKPMGIAIDTKGYLYVTEKAGGRLRMITPDGVVSTLTGYGNSLSIDSTGFRPGFYEPAGIAITNDGVLYIMDQGNNQVRKVVIQ